MRHRSQSHFLVFAAALAVTSGAWAATPPSSNAAHAPAAHGGAPHWEYSGEAGPDAWGKLSRDFATCSLGHHQSPIDLSLGVPAPSDRQRADFPPATVTVAAGAHLGDAVHNGHTIQVDFPKGDTLTIGGVPFDLVQFHFHAPSEHTEAGQHFPAEVHFVHKSAAGKLAVVGVLIKEGAANPAFETFSAALPKAEGAKAHLDKIALDVRDLVPQQRSIERYDGSLTTPPCSEQVSWFVVMTPLEFSKEQIALLKSALPVNSRPVQPANGRPVVGDELAVK